MTLYDSNEVFWLQRHTVALRSKAVKPSEAELPRFLWRTADDFKPIPGARKRPIPTFNIDENELWSNAFEGFYLIQVCKQLLLTLTSVYPPIACRVGPTSMRALQ